MLEALLACTATDCASQVTSAVASSAHAGAICDGGHCNTQLWEWQNAKAGVYDNAWDNLDTTPHVWTHTEPVDPTEIDSWIPYGQVHPSTAASNSGIMLGAAQLKAAYDGTCNPMPGWNVNWNPVSGGGCTVNPMYNQPGLGDGASFGSGSPALAMPVATPEAKDMDASTPAQPVSGSKTLRPTCGHFFLATEACLFGMVSATSSMVGKMLEGDQRAIENWNDEFKATSSAAAASVTPMGEFVLRKHVFKTTQA